MGGRVIQRQHFLAQLVEQDADVISVVATEPYRRVAIDARAGIKDVALSSVADDNNPQLRSDRKQLLWKDKGALP